MKPIKGKSLPAPTQQMRRKQDEQMAQAGGGFSTRAVLSKPLSWLARLAMLVLLLGTSGVQLASAASLPPNPSTGLIQPLTPETRPMGVVPSAPSTPAAPVSVSSDYRITPGDELALHFDFMPEMNATQTVRPDGRIDLPLIGTQQAAGLTADQLRDQLHTAYAAKVRRPDLSIDIVRGFANQQVFVGGEVTRPGVQRLTPSMTALQAILVAEGFRDTANPGKVAILRRGPDGGAQVIPVDVDAVMDLKEGSSDVALQPFDVVLVPRSTIANIDLWIDQYIRRVIPFQSGFSYVINRNIGNGSN